MCDIVEYVNEDADQARVVLIGDHSSNRLPDSVPAEMRLPVDEMERHIAWDIGVDGVMRHMATMMGVPAVFARYSRLWVDLNRHPDEQDCIRLVYDGTEIPFNAGLSEEERDERLARYFFPYHDGVADMLRQHPRALPVFVHSFTPALRDDPHPRPWEIAVLWREDEATARKAMDWLRENTSYCIGDNEPYSLFKHACYTPEVHCYPNTLPHLILEVRQDLIADADQQKHIAETLVNLVNYLT